MVGTRTPREKASKTSEALAEVGGYITRGRAVQPPRAMPKHKHKHKSKHKNMTPRTHPLTHALIADVESVHTDLVHAKKQIEGAIHAVEGALRTLKGRL